MKLPLLPVHILTTDGLVKKIDKARTQVQDSHKEDREKTNRALSRLLGRNHQLGLAIIERDKTIKEFRKGRQKNVGQAGNRSG